MSTLRTKFTINKIAFDFISITHSVENLNYGGCGLFAEYAYELFVRLGFKPTLAIISKEPAKAQDDINNNRNGDITPFSHIVLIVNDAVIDSEGIYKTFTEIPAYNYSRFELVKGVPFELLK